jgi:phage terminase large subunit-like protein
VYAQKRQFIEDVAAGVIMAPATYGVVFAADEKDDPHAESTWAKASPLYPVTPSPAFMRAACGQGPGEPGRAGVSFLRLHLGIRAGAGPAVPRPAEVGPERVGLADRRGGLLAGRLAVSAGSTWAAASDLTALVWLLPGGPAGFDVLCRFWLPEAAVPALDSGDDLGERVGVGRRGMDHARPPGDVTDYDFIQAHDRGGPWTPSTSPGLGCRPVERDADRSTICWPKDAPVESVGQGYPVACRRPLKETGPAGYGARDEAERPLWRHGGNPVLRWMARQPAAAKVDPAGNVAPDKARSRSNKIDGISAAFTALFVVLNADAQEAAGEILF